MKNSEGIPLVLVLVPVLFASHLGVVSDAYAVPDDNVDPNVNGALPFNLDA